MNLNQRQQNSQQSSWPLIENSTHIEYNEAVLLHLRVLLMLKKIQKSLIIAMSVVASSASFSEPLSCPNSIEFDQHFQLPPTGYDAKTHQIKQMIVSTNSHNKNWLLFLNPLRTSPDDDTNNQINEALEQLNPVSATAYSKNLGRNQSNLQYCIYHLHICFH